MPNGTGRIGARRIGSPGTGPLPALGTLALALLLAACGADAEAGMSDGSDAAQAADAGSYSRVINVEVAPIEARSFTERIRLTGTVEANRDILVPAEEDGVIRQMIVAEGSVVRAGQPIAKIDDEILRHQLAQAEARASVAKETYERNRQLYEEEKAISELQFLEVASRSREADASRDLLAERVARTTIRAPFAGVLEERRVELGEMVSVGDPVARLVELDPLEISAGVPERYASDVRVGTSATVTFDVLPGRSFEARLSHVGSVVSRENRTFRAEFSLPNPEGVVKPEMVANVTLLRRELESAVVVPQEALVRAEDGFVAFVVEESGESGETVARQRTVELGPSQRNEVVVTSGLAPGDRLVVVGQKQVAEGDRVSVVGVRELDEAGAASRAAGETAAVESAEAAEGAPAADGAER